MFIEPDGATPLDPDERLGLLHDYVTTRAELNELEQANIISAMQWIGRQRRLDILDVGKSLRLHRECFGEVWAWAGQFRKTEKNIGIAPYLIGVESGKALDDARYWVENETFSPLEAAARLHHRLVQIHPFPNGNGRWARIMSDEYLRQYYDRPPIDWAAGQVLDNDSPRRTEYIAALRAADGYEFDPLLKFVGI